MRKLSLLSALLILMVAVVPAFAGQGTPATAPMPAQDGDDMIVFAPGETVQFGMAVDLSNLLPAPGEDMANAATLAFIQFNEGADILGFEAELMVEDDRCAPEDATSVANLFASNPQIVGVVGHMCSGATIAASEIYEDAGIPMVSPSATAGAVTARGLSVVNRTAFNDNVQSIVSARYIVEVLGAETVAVLHDNSDYGNGLASSVNETLQGLGVEVTTFEVVDPDEQDYRSQLTVIAGDAPDLVYFGGYQNQAASLVEQMREVGLEDTIFFAPDGVNTQDYLDLAGDNGDGTYVTFGQGIGSVEESNVAFDEAYEAEFSVAPDDLGPFHAQAYDAANVLLAAAQEVAELDDDGNLMISRSAMIEAVRATADFQGISGTITCTETGDCGTLLISVFVAEDGEWVEVDVPAELQVFQVEE